MAVWETNECIRGACGERSRAILYLAEGRFYYLSFNFEDGKWSIHGLWPQNSATSHPQYCRTVQFDLQKLSPILPQLRSSWTSNRGSDEVFWQHEWEKHGSCMFNNCDEFEYFNKALELFTYVINEGLVSNTKPVALPPWCPLTWHSNCFRRQTSRSEQPSLHS